MEAKRIVQTIVVVFTALSLAPLLQGGCGGGSGGDGRLGTLGTETTTPTTLSVAGASSIFSEVLSGGTILNDSALGAVNIGNSQTASALSVDTGRDTMTRRVERIVSRVRNELRDRSVHSLSSESFTGTCDNYPAGAMKISMDSKSSTTSTPWGCSTTDLHVNMAMQNCIDDALGTELDGTIDITVPGPWNPCTDSPTEMQLELNATITDMTTTPPSVYQLDQLTLDLSRITWNPDC